MRFTVHSLWIPPQETEIISTYWEAALADLDDVWGVQAAFQIAVADFRARDADVQGELPAHHLTNALQNHQGENASGSRSSRRTRRYGC